MVQVASNVLDIRNSMAWQNVEKVSFQIVAQNSLQIFLFIL